MFCASTRASTTARVAMSSLRMFDRFQQHLCHLFLAETMLWLTSMLCSTSASEFFCFDLKNAICIQDELYLHFRKSGRHARNTGQNELRQFPVVANQIPFTLKDRDLQIGLAIYRCGVLSAGRGGTLLFRGMITSISPPMVSIPKDKGVISSSNISVWLPARISA